VAVTDAVAVPGAACSAAGASGTRGSARCVEGKMKGGALTAGATGEAAGWRPSAARTGAAAGDRAHAVSGRAGRGWAGGSAGAVRAGGSSGSTVAGASAAGGSAIVL